MLPNWIIAGVPKAGTSSVFRWLVDHPEVDGPSDKETYYCIDPGTHMFRADSNWGGQGLAGYEKLFARCDPSARVLVECTPGYVYSKTALRELPSLPGKPQFIFVLREPVAQLQSLFAYFQQNWNWVPRDMSFREFIAAVEQRRHDFKGNELAADALANAWYPEHLRRWQAAVGADRMVVLLFEDLVSDSRSVMRGLAERMGIEPAFYDCYKFPHENETYAARSGLLQDVNIWIRSRLPKGRAYDALRSLYRALNTRPLEAATADSDVLQRLAEHYAPMAEELEQDFGLDLTKWGIARPAGQRLHGMTAPGSADDLLQVPALRSRACAR